MLDSLKKLYRLISSLFGDNVPEGIAWDRIPPELMTPRERLLRRSSLIMLWGAVLNLLAALIAIGAAIHAANQEAALFATLQEAALSRFITDADTAALLVIAAILANAAILLVLAAVIMAQELWTVFTAWLLTAANLAALLAFGFTPAILAIVPLLTVGLMTIGDLRAFRLNPVMVKELRGRMRGVRGFAIITIFLTLMSFFTVLLYLLRAPAGGVVVTGDLGRELFIGVLFIELMLIIFIVPALTSGAITNERERKTYDLLQTTLITKATFVVGKLQSALGYIVLLLLSAIPLQSIAFLFGGVSEAELILAPARAAGFGHCAGRVRHVLFLHHRAHAGGHHPLLYRRPRHHRRLAARRADPLPKRLRQCRQQLHQPLHRQSHGGSDCDISRYDRHQPQSNHGHPALAADAHRSSATGDHARHPRQQRRVHSNSVAWVLLTLVYLSVTALLVLISIRRMERQGGVANQSMRFSAVYAGCAYLNVRRGLCGATNCSMKDLLA